MNNMQYSRLPLFQGMRDAEIQSALSFTSAREKNYSKGTGILFAGDTADAMGLVLEGSVTIESNDMWGNRTILSHVGEGQIFGETYAWLTHEPMLVDAVANEDCRVLFLKISGLRKVTEPIASWQYQLMENLLTISARKNLILSGRSFHTAPKTIRGKVMSYLNSVSLQKGSREFDIPFDRQQLADYLNLDRTALSKELGNMQRDGMITCSRNHFVLNTL